MRCILLLLVSVDNLFCDLSRFDPVRLFRAPNNILLLHSIIDTDMPERGATSLINRKTTPQMLDRLLAVQRFFSQANALDPVSNCV